MNCYTITLRGQVDVEEINAASPHQMTQVEAASAATMVTIVTDQSGLLGLIRHLHNLGFEIISIIRPTERKEQ